MNCRVIISTLAATYCLVLGISPVFAGDKWGLIRLDGTSVIEPKFDNIIDLGGDALLFESKVTDEKSTYWIVDNREKLNQLEPPAGCVFEKGNSPAYYRSGKNSQALFHIRKIDDNKVGLIDQNGHVVVEPIYDTIDYFADGHTVGTRNNDTFIFDLAGTITGAVNNPLLQPVGLFYQGMCAVKDENGYGVIDYKGKILAPTIYKNAYPNGDFKVMVETSELNSDGKPQTLLVDKDGNLTSPPLTPLGPKVVGIKGKFKLIGKGGKELLPGEYNLIWECPGGFFAYSDAEVLLVDKVGKITARLPGVNAVVVSNDRFVAVATGGDACPTRGETAKPNSIWGYADRSGRFVIEPKFRMANPFIGNLATVDVSYEKNEENFGVIDRNGDFVIPPKYRAILLTSTHAAVAVGSRDFNTEEWINECAGLGQKSYQKSLQQFFRDYKVIGLPKEQLIKLLGPPSAAEGNVVRYLISGSSCGNGVPGISFDIDKSMKVYRWKNTTGDAPSVWKTNSSYDENL